MFELVLPQTPEAWLAWSVPLATLVIGLAYFLTPASVLGHLGLQGSVGEARSSFAGFLVGLSLAAILFDQPVLLQQLGLAWAFAAIGKLVHVGLDGARGLSVMTRLALAAAFAGLACALAGLPDATRLAMPAAVPQMLIAGAGLLTALTGVLALVAPGLLAGVLNLVPEDGEAATGELRGSHAGFHLAAGLGVLVADGPFTELALGACWLLSAFGRMISMLSERDRLLFNWAMLVAEIAIGSAVLAVVFGMVA
ncbi:MAG: hypothetical protein KDJ90_22255 [Nitratireductor sp.]|nr:hypothetical protein [Nitratireductor sp.]